jgi:glycosyltransferase involved in cell wall biosynthesis
MTGKSTIKEIHIWVPELVATKGGIQVFSGHLIEALANIIGSESVRVFSKGDAQPPSDGRCNLKFRGSGCWPKSLRTPPFAGRVILEGLRHHPTLVIATHLNFSVAARWLKKITGIPYWCIAHGIEAWNLHRRDRVAGIREADRLLAVSSYTRDRLLQEQSLLPGQVNILPNTFCPDTFRPGPKPESLLRRYAIGARKKVILTVARLADPRGFKGYDQILRALPRIRQGVPDVHYLLVGKGPDRHRIERLIADLGVGDSVTLAGYIPDTDLVDYYNLCDIFAMPSKGEGFGIVYLEAMACGKPVLAGNADGSADPLQQGKVGALVDPDDVEAIAESLIHILKGTYPLPILYRPEELRARAIEAFGFESFSATLAEYLNDFGHRHGQPLCFQRSQTALT